MEGTAWNPSLKLTHNFAHTVQKGSVADPDPGSGAFLTPGSGIQDPEYVFSGSRIPDPKPIFLRA
jgi:hypothetical protein